MNPFILLLIGLLLIFLEFYVPGAILGTFGGLFVFASVVFFAMESESLLMTILYVMGTCVALVFLFKFALWRIRTANPLNSIYSNSDQEGFVASKFDTDAIGKSGTVDTDLKPGGHIIVQGKRMGAISRSGYITKGTTVTVIGGEGESLIVKLSKKETQL